MVVYKRIHQRFGDNYLLFGDNLLGLEYCLNELNLKGKVDLVYIDPPYNTGRVFRMGNSISRSETGEIAYNDKYDFDEYLEFIHKRVELIYELLSDRGSFYLHCDYKVNHYLKVLCDKVFGRKFFRSDITRIKCNSKNFKRKNYGNIKDCILFYTKTDDYIWNNPRIPYTDEELERIYNKIDDDGERYCTESLSAPGVVVNGDTGKDWRGVSPPVGRHWCTNPSVFDEWDKKGLIEWSPNGVPRKKVYASERKDKGKVLQDIWEFKDPPRVEYPTTKNSELLETIIRASSNPNSIVLDCFCGSGTTLKVARDNNRKYIGIDSGSESVKLLKRDLKDSNWIEIL